MKNFSKKIEKKILNNIKNIIFKYLLKSLIKTNPKVFRDLIKYKYSMYIIKWLHIEVIIAP